MNELTVTRYAALGTRYLVLGTWYSASSRSSTRDPVMQAENPLLESGDRPHWQVLFREVPQLHRHQKVTLQLSELSKRDPKKVRHLLGPSPSGAFSDVGRHRDRGASNLGRQTEQLSSGHRRCERVDGHCQIDPFLPHLQAAKIVHIARPTASRHILPVPSTEYSVRRIDL